MTWLLIGAAVTGTAAIIMWLRHPGDLGRSWLAAFRSRGEDEEDILLTHEADPTAALLDEEHVEDFTAWADDYEAWRDEQKRTFGRLVHRALRRDGAE